MQPTPETPADLRARLAAAIAPYFTTDPASYVPEILHDATYLENHDLNTNEDEDAPEELRAAVAALDYLESHKPAHAPKWRDWLPMTDLKEDPLGNVEYWAQAYEAWNLDPRTEEVHEMVTDGEAPAALARAQKLRTIYAHGKDQHNHAGHWYIAHDETVISGFGTTPDEAAADATNGTDTREVYDLKVTRCTRALAAAVEAQGGDVPYGWIADDVAGTVEEEERTEAGETTAAEILTDDAISIPVSILRDRGNLSTMQALSLYLCEDTDGPNLTQADAARVLGLGESRQQIGTHLTRARATLAGNPPAALLDTIPPDDDTAGGS